MAPKRKEQMVHAILVINLLAAICGSAAIAMLAAVQRSRFTLIGKHFLRTFGFMTVVVVCNGLDAYFWYVLSWTDPRLRFLLMNALFLFTLAVSGMALTIAGELVARQASPGQKRAFILLCLAVYTLGIALVLGTGSESGNLAINTDIGYFVSALFTLASTVAAMVIVLAGRDRLPMAWRKPAMGFLTVLGVFLVFALGSETGWWERWLGLPRTAMSPFVLILGSLFALPRAIALLTDARGLTPGTTVPADAKGAVVPVDPGEASIPEAWDLSEREKEVLRLLVAGHDNPTIGEKLFISRNTVKNHAYNIYRKSGARNRVDLIRLLSTLS